MSVNNLLKRQTQQQHTPATILLMTDSISISLQQITYRYLSHSLHV